MKPAVTVTLIFLSIVALLHLLRLLFSVGVTVDGTVVPMWASIFACLGPAALAVWLWLEQRSSREPAT
jgi:uncharacterized membrane protein YbhN (UPF0104 family)